MTRCVFPIVAKVDKESIDTYLQQRIQKAVDGDWDSLSLLSMQQHPIALSGATIQEIRNEFAASEHLFKPEACYAFATCCGDCGKACSVRCVQDILQKLHLMALTHPAIKLQLEDVQWCTYDHLITLLNDSMKQDYHGRTHYCFDYAPVCEYTQNKTGKFRPKADANGWCITHWPVSGLCPFCLPKFALKEPTTGRRKNGKI